ncbi:hypothetical protein [Actinomadura litoris]|uniref:hypothetical protein n=1 Tax=Actinomadura litoris TaxID=2678616 RepID=UPI001FA7A570|nr:hypothetical protein [Actinomadura litoris]
MHGDHANGMIGVVTPFSGRTLERDPIELTRFRNASVKGKCLADAVAREWRQDGVVGR